MPPNTKHRNSIRLPGCDYSLPGFYFITICTYQRECLFGEIKEGQMFLNENGKIVEQEWFKTPEIRKEIILDEFIIMPNHIHGIILINDQNTENNNIIVSSVGAKGSSPLRMQPKSISSFVSGFKSSVTTQINTLRQTPGNPVWQRNYFEHIIRNDTVLQKIREYIINNPIKWFDDADNPRNWKK
jgi:REP element-mobilizing transposase RayT